VAESAEDAYERGTVAGRVEQRLNEHATHLDKINGSMERVANELHGLKLAVQLLSQQAISRDATVVTTAAALKDAEEARRSKTEASWSPWQKLFAVLGAAAAMAAVIGLYFALKGQ
jgi:hypothetical protein